VPLQRNDRAAPGFSSIIEREKPMSDSTDTSTLKPSDEADRKGLDLGRAQGEALTRTLKHMTDEVATDGREEQVGEYLVGYAVEKAEGMYHPKAGDLEWKAPGDHNAHIEISVRDAADGRFIPGLEVEVTLTAPDGSEHGPQHLPLLWHPYLYHYGRNWTVPESGAYSLKVHFDAPKMPRHDKTNGKRFVAGCTHVFEGVKIETGQG
jgi:hypothetical protein